MASFIHRLERLYVNAFTGLPRKVWLLALVMLVNRSGAMVVAFLSVYLIGSEGFALQDAGYIMAAFGAGGVVGNYCGGLLNDRFGSWHIQVYSLVGAGLLNIALGQVSGFYALCGLSFTISLWADAFRPANRAAIAVYSPPDRLAGAYGLQRMAANLGYSVGPAAGGWLIYNYGYELMFWGDGLTFLVAAAVFYFTLPPDETARPLVARAGEATPAASATLAPVSAPEHGPPAHRQPWLMAFVLANACFMMCFFQLFNIFPVFMAEVGLDERAIGWLFTLSGVLIVAVEMPLIYAVERRYRPVPVMLFGGALIVVAYALVALLAGGGFWPVLGAIMVLTLGEIFYMPYTSTYVSQHAPAARRGEYLGVLSASYSLAFVVTPLVGFAVAEDYGYAAATLVCCATGAVGWLVLTRVNAIRTRSVGGSPWRMGRKSYL